MSRSPLSYPLNRGADLDGGGVADLQTDVMRFMAILSLCLVAIFALVQSIPASPPIAEPTPVERSPEPAAEPVAARPAPRPVAEPAAEPVPESSPEPVAQAPRAAPIEAPDVATPPARAAPVAEPEEEGFTLRFASDTALKALVARDEVGVYAIAGTRAMRLGNERGRLVFWQASLPGKVHEMDAATVPADVRQALQRSGAANDVYWGVTLPSRLARQLDRYLGEARGGELVIAADGNMRLE